MNDSILRSLSLCSVCAFAALFCSPIHADQKMTELFNGQDLSGWKISARKLTAQQAMEQNVWWIADDGILKARSGPKKIGSILWTEKEYTDFVLQLDFRFIDGHIDSGIHLRGMDQIQIGISGSLKRDMTCSPYIPGKGYPVEAERIQELLKMTDWNTIKVEVQGMNYTCYLNGTKVMTYTSDTGSERGSIGLQIHQGREMSIDFRDIQLRELSGNAPN